MPKPDRYRPHSIVETAMARAARNTPASPTPATAITPHWGSEPPTVEATPSPTGPIPPRPADENQALARQSAGTRPEQASSPTTPTRCGRLVASHLGAAAAGAILMWSLTNAPSRPVAAPAPAGQAPAVAAMPPLAKATPAMRAVTVPPAPLEPQVHDMLERWRQAWSRRDVDAYLSSYSADFVPADGATRSAWAEGRRKNLLGRSRIDVQLRDIKLSPQADGQVKVSLLQDYASDHYRETSRPKTLLLIREGGGWRIAREWQEAQGAR